MLNVVWGMRWIILASVALCLLLAWCYIKVTKPKYTATGKIMLVTKGNSDLVNLSDLISGFDSKSSYMTNEMEVLGSHTLLQKVVEEYGLNYTYIKERPLKDILLYGNNPFQVLIDSTENFANPPQASITFTPTDSSSFKIKKVLLKGEKYPLESDTYHFGEQFPIDRYNFIIEETHLGKFEAGEDYTIRMVPSRITAKGLRGNISLSSMSKAAAGL